MKAEFGPSANEIRTAFEQDYDRLLFSTPVRRLADKTQVFPLEKNDSVRNRLTHSHEVSNLARSIGTRLIRIDKNLFGDSEEIRQAVPVILASIGLAHDLGNPPFGHQGEESIQRWFKENDFLFLKRSKVETDDSVGFIPLPKEHHSDFLKFEGNAQGLRLICRLQNTVGPAGLDLTAATLAALMKYPVCSAEVDASQAASKKYGYFISELETIEWVRRETGLSKGQRHPLTWLMEASDDIAYSVLDIEDAVKKGLVSPEDALAFLRGRFSLTDLGGLANQLTEDFKRADEGNFGLSRAREIKTGYLRTRLIDRLLSGVTNTYLTDRTAIFEGNRTKSLLGCGSDESNLYEALKWFATVYAYRSQDVLGLEYGGDNILRTLMDDMWEAISSRKTFMKLESRRTTPKARFVYSLISDSYRWHFENGSDSSTSIRYRELQLLSDMMSGMTDGYAVDLHKRIRDACA